VKVSSRNLLLVIICMAFPHAPPEVAFAADAKNGIDFATYQKVQSYFEKMVAPKRPISTSSMLTIIE